MNGGRSLDGPTIFEADAFRGASGTVVVRGADGVWRQADAVERETGRGSYTGACERSHGRLRGRQRCRGCGRTANEIELDEGL